MGFTQSFSGTLGDLDGYIQLFPGTYKKDRPINITSIDKVHIKCGCIDGSILNGIRQPILYSFALDQPPGQKIYNEPKVKLLKKVDKSVFSHTRFYLEDGDHKEFDFSGETISFTCQPIKIKNSSLYTYNYISIHTRGIHTFIFVSISETYFY